MSTAFRTAIIDALPNAALPDSIERDTFLRFTNGRSGDRSGWCRLFADGRAGVFGCWRTGLSETWTATDRSTMTPAERAALARQIAEAAAERREQQRVQWAANGKRIAHLQERSVQPVPDDPVGLYLKRRGFTSWPPPPTLRLVRALSYWHEGEKITELPAMVAPVQEPYGRTVAMHCTFLTNDGAKASVPGPVKKLTPAAGLLAGGCIRLHHARDGVIGIAEGIETALAASMASGLPTVAAYCAGAMAGWQWPTTGVRRIVIFADADKAGREAAETLRKRATTYGMVTQVLVPSMDGADWADVWAARPSGVSQ